MSFWTDAASKPQVESQGDFPTLPPGKWYNSNTTTGENGEAKPRIRKVDFKNGDHAFEFNVGLIVNGGERDVDTKFKGQFCFFTSWTSPNPKGDQADNLLSGRLTGFLNAIYANGVAVDEKDKEVKAQERWQVTIKALQAIAEDKGLTEDQFPSPDVFIAAVAIADMQENSHQVLFKTRSESYKTKEGVEKTSIKVGAYEDAVEVNLDKRKVSLFEDRGTDGSTF